MEPAPAVVFTLFVAGPLTHPIASSILLTAHIRR